MRKSTSTLAKAPKMTAEEARSIPTRSIQNMVTVIQARPCGCMPYRDVFTFARWIAQGYVVRKGEKAIKIPVVVTREDEDDETKTRQILQSTAVFCRCQVKPLDGDAPPAVERPSAKGTPQAIAAVEPIEASKAVAEAVAIVENSAPLPEIKGRFESRWMRHFTPCQEHRPAHQLLVNAKGTPQANRAGGIVKNIVSNCPECKERTRIALRNWAIEQASKPSTLYVAGYNSRIALKTVRGSKAAA